MKKIIKKLTGSKLYILAAVVVVAVIAVATTMSSQYNVSQADVLRSSAQSSGTIYIYKNKYVSAVVSPVSSVIISKVTSRIGTSRITSKVASVITSPVASAVTLSKNATKYINVSKVPKLTASILKSVAKADYIKNRAKYTLTNAKKMQIIKAYQKKYPKAFKI